jgi:PRTRC genetic system protein C
MLIANELPRKFLFNNDGIDVDLPDPQSSFSPDSVLNFYAPTYPYPDDSKN